MSSLHCAQGIFDHRMFAPCATQSRTDVHCQPWVPDPTAHAYIFVQLKWQSDGYFDSMDTSTVMAFVIIPFQTSCMSFTPWNKNLDGSDETCLTKRCGNLYILVSWKAMYPVSTKQNWRAITPLREITPPLAWFLNSLYKMDRGVIRVTEELCWGWKHGVSFEHGLENVELSTCCANSKCGVHSSLLCVFVIFSMEVVHRLYRCKYFSSCLVYSGGWLIRDFVF